MIHWFDIFVLCFLAASAIWSYFRGMAKETFSLASLVAGYFVASRYYVKAGEALAPVLPDRTLQEIVAFVVLFFMTVIMVVVVGILVRRLMRVSETVSAADKIAGAGLGLLKGGVILAIAAYPMALIPGLKDDLTAGSRVAPTIIGVSSALFDLVSPQVSATLSKAGEKSGAAKEKIEGVEKARKAFGVLTDNVGGIGSAIKRLSADENKPAGVPTPTPKPKSAPAPTPRPEEGMDSAGMEKLLEEHDK